MAPARASYCHISLMACLLAQGVAFPQTPEVTVNRVYKLRSTTYIKEGREFYFSRVDFEDDYFISEIRSRALKEDSAGPPDGAMGTPAADIWTRMSTNDNDHYETSVSVGTKSAKEFEEVFRKNCVLYFPFNRFEEPAWLNAENLMAQAHYTDIRNLTGTTPRRVIATSPLHDNQNWLFDVIYDMTAFELETRESRSPVEDGGTSDSLPLFVGYTGRSTQMYIAVLQIVRVVTRREDARIGIGRRNRRVVSIESDSGRLVPNVFQMSSGETSLLNLFSAILRDFDLSGAPFSNVADVRGIVVVDEVDLHLHSVFQYEVLPSLIKMFPKVQFIVTSHSPLFVLGMQKVFGDDGFALYQLPQGQQISPEDFSEFGEAYKSFANSREVHGGSGEGNQTRTQTGAVARGSNRYSLS